MPKLTDMTARFLLASGGLLAYVSVSLTFSVFPPKLAVTDATAVLNTLSYLTIMAFTFFFHGAITSEPSNKVTIPANSDTTTTVHTENK